MQPLSSVPDDALLEALHAIVDSHRRTTAEFVVHLGEVDARRLHLDKGFSSLFVYCTEELRLSEDEAYRRIEAARLGRRFPAVHALLETGALSLSVLCLLKPHLNEGNHRELFLLVSGASVRRAKERLAARFPAPDVQSTIRKLPERRSLRTAPLVPAASESMPTKSGLNGAEPPRDTPPRVNAEPEYGAPSRAHRGNAEPARDALRPAPPRGNAEPEYGAPLFAPRGNAEPARDALRPAPPRANAEPEHGASLLAPLGNPEPSHGEPSHAHRARVEPLSRDRFLVKFTASRALTEKLEHARDSMRHSNPDGALEVILERALDLLIADLQKKQQGRTSRPRKEPQPSKDTHVTRATRREVVARDGWRCAYVSEDGRRCDARAFLEFDHETPRGCGGGHQADNLRVLCRAHNFRAAELVYGKELVARAISESRAGPKMRRSG